MGAFVKPYKFGTSFADWHGATAHGHIKPDRLVVTVHSDSAQGSRRYVEKSAQQSPGCVIFGHPTQDFLHTDGNKRPVTVNPAGDGSSIGILKIAA